MSRSCQLSARPRSHLLIILSPSLSHNPHTPPLPINRDPTSAILASRLADAVWEISPKAGRRETSLGLGPEPVLEHEPAESGMDQRSRIQGPTTRRVVLRRSVAVAIAILAPRVAPQESGAGPGQDWAAMREDPVRKRLRGRPDLDTILTLYPRTQGPPAFDPGRIAEGMRSLRTHPPVNTGHSFLDRSVKVGLSHIDATFRGDHPKYGVGTYAARSTTASRPRSSRPSMRCRPGA